MGLFNWFKSPPPLDDETRLMVERAVAAIDPMIRQLPDYQRKLAAPVRHALDYCTDIAARIPGPYEISRAAFASDPMVHALFGSAENIETMLATSQCTREHLQEMSLGSGQCCALLGMRHREKTGYGTRISGDVLRRDEPQTALYFSDHTLSEPAADIDAVRNRLRLAMFDSLLKSLAGQIDKLRTEQAALNKEHAIESAWARSRQGKNPAAQSRRLDELGKRLQAVAAQLQAPQLLDMLVKCLAAPESYLRLTPLQVAVDRTGVITDTPGAGDTLNFAELASRDKRRWVVILARIDREEARRAQDRFESSRRHIVI